MIIDASVVAKWFLRGEDWEKESEKLRLLFENGEIDLRAPSLLIYEIGNVIWKRKDIPREVAAELMEKATKYLEEITLDITPQIAEKAIKIAKSENITFYDATYIALSEIYGESLVTADKTLYEKTRGEYMVKFISQIA